MSAESKALLESLEVAQTLKEQNKALKDAYDELKKEYESKESDLQNLYEKWNNELKVQAQHFERLQSEMIPSTELHALRAKILEEFEANNSPKIDWMQSEMQKYQSLYSQTLQTLKVNQLNYENKENLLKQSIDEQKSDFEQKLSKIATKNQSVSQRECLFENLQKDFQQTNSENIELKERIKCLTQQIDLLQKRNSEISSDLEIKKIEYLAKTKDFERDTLLKQTEIKQTNEKWTDLQMEYQQTKQKCVSLQNDLQQLQNQNIVQKNEIESKKTEIANLSHSFNKKQKSLHYKSEKQIQALNEKINSLDTELKTAHSINETLKSQAIDLKNEHLRELQQLKQSKNETEGKWQEMERKYFEFEQQSNKKIDLLTKEIATEKATNECITKENENLLHRNEKYKENLKDSAKEIEKLKNDKQEINEKCEKLQQQMSDIKEENHKLAANEMGYLNKIEYLEKDIKSLTAQIDEKFNKMHSSFKQQIDALQSEKENNLKQITKMKKEKQKYKKLVTSAKVKIVSLSKELKAFKRSTETETRSKQMEIDNLKQQIQEIERQRDEMKFHLTTDSKQCGDSQNDNDMIADNVDIFLKELQKEQQKLNQIN